jgi:dUTP pyrophosphatase
LVGDDWRIRSARIEEERYANAPERGTGAVSPDSAGYDLKAWFAGDSVEIWEPGGARVGRALTRESAGSVLTLGPGERAVIPLGLRATLPAGFEAQVRARSGTALKLVGLILANGPGTIDPDYIGEWGVLVLNASGTGVRIAHGDRIAQLVVARFETVTFETGVVRQTTERTGGFGSTGTR